VPPRPNVSTIAVVRAERPFRLLDRSRSREGGATTQRGDQAWETGRVYADVVVDGVALSTHMRRKGDHISCLGWGPKPMQDDAVARLLMQAPPDLASGRVSLYVCPECGDLSCGAITVRIERRGDVVTWRDFWYEGDYEGFPSNNTLLEDLGPYFFAWEEYQGAVKAGYGIGGFDP
jgi:hypothetical protein